MHRVIDSADLIINVGHDVVEKPPFFMKDDGRQVIHINFEPAAVDPVYFPQLEVIGDIANTIWQIKEQITANANWDFSFFFTAHKAYLEHKAESENDDRFPFCPSVLLEIFVPPCQMMA